jgi:hypothetical protein
MAGECCNHAPALVSGGVKLQVGMVLPVDIR